ncbi:MAG: LarC family nickel insertion protein [Clostridiales Family XIII bacterium]|jgi:uncharacterized protein (TIGR00299 family) protein|nr:LarC family nickel insertion protein [Clostridiales Family XIII bacterium]
MTKTEKKKTIYIDCGSGISGDMTLGALIHLGADVERIKTELRKLAIGSFDLLATPAVKNGIGGVDLQVILPEAQPSEGHGNHTHFSQIREMIQGSELTDYVKDTALRIFTKIAEAEGVIHGMKTEDVVFHEVGAMDSILDIVGTAVALDLLGVEKVFVSRIHDGHGQIECRHGRIPVPVPAVLEMARNSNLTIVVDEEVSTEMVTPTGFGILLGLGAEYRAELDIVPEKIGYGFGKRETGRFPAVRVIMGAIGI